MSETWWGKLRKLVAIACANCGFEDEFPSAAEARRQGWRKRGMWFCPNCQEELKSRKEVTNAP